MTYKLALSGLVALAGTLCACSSEENSDHRSAALSSGSENSTKTKALFSKQAAATNVVEVLFDFDDGQIPPEFSFHNSKASLVDDGSGGKALNIKFGSKEHLHTSFAISSEPGWDWRELGDISFALDIANAGDVSSSLWINTSDGHGATYTRATSVATGPAQTYYGKLAGHDLASPSDKVNIELNFESGLRSNPPTWPSDDNMFVSMWGKKDLDISNIKQISFSVDYALRDREITIDNVRLIQNPKADANFLSGIVDQYGQNAKQEFPGKIHSDAELLAQRDAELSRLKAGKPKGRSKFNAWAEGPKLKASGYFRTEKVDGKWYLVDPEGYLYFGTGIDIIRLSNSTTMTGYDFDPASIKQRSADDLTPEDSEGLNRAPDAAVKTRHKVSDLRANMFNWLPSYDEPLGKHFGYRREAHSGPMAKGEVFSFYSANLERKYGQDGADYMQAWRNVTIDRMLNWGFASLGNWTDPSFYDNKRIPFFANGWIIGNYKTVSSGNDFWAALPDVFDPEFERRAFATVQQVADEVKGTPWCVGVFIDNEKSFGRAESTESQLGIVLHTLTRDGNDVPSKAEFTRLMKEKYRDIAQLNKAWGKQITSWQTFNQGIDSSLANEGSAQRSQQIKDYEDLLYAYGAKYYGTVNKAMKKLMPNHLYLGSRFADWGMPWPMVQAAADNVDVVSYNNYKDGMPAKRWAFLEKYDKPSIIGEFHFGSLESGMYHPGVTLAASNADRARAYTEYMHSVIDNPYMVGAHWFQYIDSPLTGRAYDGENYNVGFVRVTDVPYQDMVEAAQKLHKNMYRRRYYGNLD
ncbi:beta-galactosidase [Agaribacterium haliotis]|uniref:beta-galactosidase n=1 Tax=Agaribacterium haliotis TaxID=2013869 RepID=UPI000BB58915|nr:beta-galactosidase [Agaribacterium haliotis]